MLDDIQQVITHLLIPSQMDLCLDRVICDELTYTLILEVTSTQETPRCCDLKHNLAAAESITLPLLGGFEGG